MSLRDKMREFKKDDPSQDLYKQFGILFNPFPASNQTTGNPRFPEAADRQAEDRVMTFFRDDKSQVVVIEGTQGVGKTNFLNHFEVEVCDALKEVEVGEALKDQKGYYVVRYLADPEETFDGTTRRLFEELGKKHLNALVQSLRSKADPVETARSHDMRVALRALVKSSEEDATQLMMEWLLGARPLKRHRQVLGVQFRIDTVESKTVALRDLAQVSGEAGVLKGIFLLLDEIEKQDGILGIRAVMRYLSALRAMIDALPRRLFLMIAVTPDALIRYSASYPALRSRLEDRLELKPLTNITAAKKLAQFYLDEARKAANRKMGKSEDDQPDVLNSNEVEDCFIGLAEQAKKHGDDGVRQREFLHRLHQLAEAKLK